MIGNAQEVIQWLFNQDKEKVFDIKEHRERRSLNANAMAWKLMTEIGNVMRLDKEEVYENMLEHYGQITVISVKADVDISEYIKHCRKIGEGHVNGKLFNHYKVMKGSSEFSTYEMSVFIDGIINECKQLGIETATPDEIERIKSLWKSGET